MFSQTPTRPYSLPQQLGIQKKTVNTMNASNAALAKSPDLCRASQDDFSDEDVNDEDLMEAGKLVKVSYMDAEFNFLAANATEFKDIDAYAQGPVASQKTSKSAAANLKRAELPERAEVSRNPTQLENGKWACNHKCKDKSA